MGSLASSSDAAAPSRWRLCATAFLGLCASGVTPADLLALEAAHLTRTPSRQEWIRGELGITPTRYVILLAGCHVRPGDRRSCANRAQCAGARSGGLFLVRRVSRHEEAFVSAGLPLDLCPGCDGLQSLSRTLVRETGADYGTRTRSPRLNSLVMCWIGGERLQDLAHIRAEA